MLSFYKTHVRQTLPQTNLRVASQYTYQSFLHLFTKYPKKFSSSSKTFPYLPKFTNRNVNIKFARWMTFYVKQRNPWIESNFSMIDTPTYPRQTTDVYLLPSQNGPRNWNKYSLLYFSPLIFPKHILKKILREFKPRGEIASEIIFSGN